MIDKKKNFSQLVFDASLNLMEVTLPSGLYPDLTNLRNLAVLTIGLQGLVLDNLGPSYPYLSYLSKMVGPLGDRLVKLFFGYNGKHGIQLVNQKVNIKQLANLGFQLPKKMPKLKYFRNDAIKIFQCGDSFQDISSERAPSLETLNICRVYKQSQHW